MPVVYSSAEYFLRNGAELMNRSTSGSERTLERRYRAFFGTNWRIAEELYAKCIDEDPPLPADASGIHLLWSLMHLKQYGTEETLSSTAGVDEKTFRKWSEIFRQRLASLEYNTVRPLP